MPKYGRHDPKNKKKNKHKRLTKDGKHIKIRRVGT
jgi:hypothetical protein